MDLIKNFFYPNKNDILDPLSLVVKLYIYSYKPVGTKISILNNRIYIQESGNFQSTVRFLNGDNKNDLINMLFPLTYACETYLNEMNKNQYTYLFEQTLLSLDKFNEMYKMNEVEHNITLLKNIVTNFLTKSNFNPKTIVPNWDEPASVLKKGFYKQTNSVWTPERLNILFGYIYEITNSISDEMVEQLILSLSIFMDYMDLIVVKLIADLHLLR